MRPDQRKKEWCVYYSLSDSSRSRRVRSSTSRQSPSKKSLTCNCALAFSDEACGRSLWYRLFGKLGAFIRPRIGLTTFVVDMILVFFGHAAALHGRDSGVRKTSAWTLAGGGNIQRSSSVSDISNSLQNCFSVSESASVQHKVGDIPGCIGAGCNNVPEHCIGRILRNRLRLTCVEMYNIFWRLNKIYYKFPHLGYSEGSWLIDRRVKVGRRALLWRSSSNKLWRSLLWFHRYLCSWTCAWCLTKTCFTACCVLYLATINIYQIRKTLRSARRGYCQPLCNFENHG